MRFDIVAPVPGILAGWQSESILARAQAAGAIDLRVHDLRDHAGDRHRTLDDYPYGGGAGMVLKPEPFFDAVAALQSEAAAAGCEPPWVVLVTPQGRRFDQALAGELAQRPQVVILCGRYEGVDERVRTRLVDQEISLGDFVITGGELAAMVLVDAVARLVPGVLGHEASAEEESFSDTTGGLRLLEYPHYTRPATFAGQQVPEVLLTGHHERVRLWRRMERLRRTLARRPDLLAGRRLGDEDRRLLARLLAEPSHEAQEATEGQKLEGHDVGVDQAGGSAES